MYDNMFPVLKTTTTRLELLELVPKLLNSEGDSSEIAKRLSLKLEELPWIYEELIVNNVAEKMGFSGLFDVFEFTKDWTLAEFY